MATPETLRRRIQSTETLRKVVQTMKALATVRIAQVRRAVVALDESVATLEFAFQVLLQREPELADVLLPRGSDAWGALLFGSDHGLCGPFNDRLARFAAERFTALEPGGEAPRIMVAGKRLRPRLAQLGYDVERALPLPGTMDATEDAVAAVVAQVEAWHDDHDVERVFVIHHQPTTGVQYQPIVFQVLPIDLAWLRSLRERAWPSPHLPMTGVDGRLLLRSLVRQHLAHVLVRAFAASQAAENAARLAAMEAAERNVDERLTQLQHTANLVRQTAVTAELLDVQSAYAASGEPGT